MAVKLTKNELKTQKDQLKQFQRYLPTLQLKKQQLQIVIRGILTELEQKNSELLAMQSGLDDWIAVFAENQLFDESLRLDKLVRPERVVTGTDNIAGVRIPVFRDLTFKDVEYNVEDYPLWVDTAVYRLKDIARLSALVKTLQRQIQLLEKELRTTSQRVNLFEKVKIPETKANIKKITVYLGDEQVAAVVRSKISKKKLQAKIDEEMEAAK